MPEFTNSEAAEEIIRGMFSTIGGDRDFGKVWSEIGAVARIHLTEPDLGFDIQSTGDVRFSGADRGDAEHHFHATCETFYSLASGSLTFIRSITENKIRVTGPVGRSIALGSALEGICRPVPGRAKN